MNLAFKYPTIVWDCACLISDSGGVEFEEEENDETLEESTGCAGEVMNYYNEMEDFTDEDSEDDVEDSYEEEDCDGQAVEVKVMKDGTKKKKKKSANYGKIASAIGKVRMEGVNVAPPDINRSTYTFSPDIENNLIRYGMSGIAKVGEDVVKAILANRPYNSIEDLTSRIKISKPQVINLIKSGAFDGLGNDRVEIMKDYVRSISDQKKRITLQNMKMLIDFKLLPSELDFECRVYNFTKYLKKRKEGIYYGLDKIALNFYEKNFDMDLLVPAEAEDYEFYIKQTAWDNIYQGYMDNVRPYVKAHNAELLKQVNDRLIADTWDKYCTGSLSKWEMDSVSFYSHPHELIYVDPERYGWSNFQELPEEPEIEKILTFGGKKVPLLKLHRIAGTVLDKDKAKKTVTLLTIEGVVTVKIFGPVFAHYDKQISERGADGKKHVIEKSFFARGNKIIVTGVRRDDSFIAKKYSKTPYHLVELITEINEDGTIRSTGERYGDEVVE